MAKNLVIVESPAKAKTIEGFLGKDFLVKSSFGHVRDLSKTTLSINVDNGFVPNYEIPADKRKVIDELKKAAKDAEMIWLASDEDREGEAIAWHLAEALELDSAKTKRIVFHEITKTAITEAIKNPRDLDQNLVNAQQARRVLDRLVGYELSPLLWKKVKPALSAGRVQSVAVRLIVERESEIREFKTTSYFKITAQFEVEKDDKIHLLKAEIPAKFATEEDAAGFLEKARNAEFSIDDIKTVPAKKSPAPPFTTSTLQQEASRKLSFSVAKTMMIAQQLYEAGKITYMRTDSVNLSGLALNMAKEEITRAFGEDYLKTRNYTTKSKGAQEAHEAIRPTYLNTPEIKGTNDQKRLYDLIWKRTIASQMSDAQIEKTTVTINGKGVKESFVATGEVLTFDGFLKVYLESSDEEDDEIQKGVLPPMSVGQKLNYNEILATEKYTQHPPRYTEASLVKKLEELGIGRPSTYAPIISTIQKRQYVVLENREGVKRPYKVLTLKNKKVTTVSKEETAGYEKSKLFPTDIGSLVNSFLVQYFINILDYNFTANVEKKFDEVAQGTVVWNDMIKEFYGPFHSQIAETQEKSKKVSGEKLLGTDPESGKNVFVKIGRFGPMVQIGDTDSEEKPRFAGLLKNQSIETITLEEALSLFSFPRKLGEYEGKEVTVSIGRFGPYVKYGSAFFSIKKGDNPLEITLARAIEIMKEKEEAEKNKLIREFAENPDVKVLNGRWGPYISIAKANYKIPKGYEPAALTLEDCLKIAEAAGVQEPKTSKTRKKKA
jgi:DNA topoisomerase-1